MALVGLSASWEVASGDLRAVVKVVSEEGAAPEEDEEEEAEAVGQVYREERVGGLDGLVDGVSASSLTDAAGAGPGPAEQGGDECSPQLPPLRLRHAASEDLVVLQPPEEYSPCEIVVSLVPSGVHVKGVQVFSTARIVELYSASRGQMEPSYFQTVRASPVRPEGPLPSTSASGQKLLECSLSDLDAIWTQVVIKLASLQNKARLEVLAVKVVTAGAYHHPADGWEVVSPGLPQAASITTTTTTTTASAPGGSTAALMMMTRLMAGSANALSGASQPAPPALARPNLATAGTPRVEATASVQPPPEPASAVLASNSIAASITEATARFSALEARMASLESKLDTVLAQLDARLTRIEAVVPVT
eukprot:jgi/Chlat1/7449/Chrsp6S07496